MVATVGSIQAVLQANMSGYVGGLNRAATATGTFESRAGRSISGINRSLSGLERQATMTGATLARTFAAGLAGGIFAGGAAGIVSGIRRINSEMAKIADTAKMVGVGIEDLQRLRYGFETMGVSVSDVDTGMRRFARRIGEAANGGGVLHDVLKANNVQLRNADGSMRSQIDLLRDYANLIQNAGSHQERLALAFKAFDVGGAAMVQALENGAAGLDTLMDKADEAGGVIDAELVKRAAELDTQFNALWRSFEIAAKSAIINVSVALRDGLLKDINAIGGALRDLWNDPSFHNAGRVLLGDNFMGDESINNVAAIERRIGTLQKQVENLRDLGFDATEAERELAQARAKLEEEVARIMAGGGGEITLPPISVTATPTIIPGGKDDDSGNRRAGGRNRAADAALREMEAVNGLIQNLQFELSLVGLSDVEKAKANALRQAGSIATDEQRAAIEALVTAIHAENEALKANEAANRAREQSLKSLFDMGSDALTGIISGSERAEDALKRLVLQLAAAALQASLLGTGPLAGLFGGGGGLFKAIGFREGGFTGDGPANEVAGAVHRGEYVFDKQATDKIGVGTLAALRKAAKSGVNTIGEVLGNLPGFRAGGLVGAFPTGGVPGEGVTGGLVR